MFDTCLQLVNLPQLTSSLYRTAAVFYAFNQSGAQGEKNKLGPEEKTAVMDLQAKGYIVLSLGQKLDFYSQAAVKEFEKSLDRLLDETIKWTVAQKQAWGETEDDSGTGEG